MHNFTPEELVLYIYGEATQEKVQEIEKALQTDWSLQQKLDVLKESQHQLNALALHQPRKQAISAILNYAREGAEIEQ